MTSSPHTTDTPMHSSIERLNHLLRSERAAIASYALGLERLGKVSIAPALRANIHGHEGRAQRLHDKIVELGGRPTDTAEPWRAFVALLAASGEGCDEHAVVRVLEAGEGDVRDDYQRELGKVHGRVSDFVQQLMTAQLKANTRISDTKVSLGAPPKSSR